jgi:hypothetical protein
MRCLSIETNTNLSPILYQKWETKKWGETQQTMGLNKYKTVINIKFLSNAIHMFSMDFP